MPLRAKAARTGGTDAWPAAATALSKKKAGALRQLCGPPGLPYQSTLAPEALTTGAQPSTSDLMKAPNSAGVVF